MIVSQSHKFVFVHIPKNAGTTVETLLMDHLDPAQDLHVSEGATLPDNREAFGIGEDAKLLKHITSHRLRRALYNGLYDQFFSFAFCRNPYSRCYSAYTFAVRRAQADQRRETKFGEDSDRDRSKFLTRSFDDICANLPEIAKEHRLFRPQTFWLREPDSVDYVGRLEHLAEDMRAIYTHLGLPLQQLDHIPTENQKAAKGAWKEMSLSAQSAIREFYASDFDRFGYDTAFDAAQEGPKNLAPVLAPSARTSRKAGPERTVRSARRARPARAGKARSADRSAKESAIESKSES